jgi:hypothetical protein
MTFSSKKISLNPMDHPEIIDGSDDDMAMNVENRQQFSEQSRLEKKQRIRGPSGSHNVMLNWQNRVLSGRKRFERFASDVPYMSAVTERLLHQNLIPRFNRDDFS